MRLGVEEGGGLPEAAPQDLFPGTVPVIPRLAIANSL
jgi:hypothetical protein